MKRYITLLLIFLSFTLNSQVIKEDPKLEKKLVRNYKFKVFTEKIYKKIFKYATIYAAGDIGNSFESPYPDYFVRTNPNNLYAVPEVIDQTQYNPFDYRIGFGIRKLARFDYEIKPKQYYDGTETNKALSAPTAAVQGFEYLLHFEKERQRGDEFTNSRFFIRHTGKHHIIKLEQREEGNVDFKYMSAEARFRLPIGKKLSISAGAIYRTHIKAYGYNPIEIWLNEVDENGFPSNPWYSLGYQYGYEDIGYTQTDSYGNQTYDWYWIDSSGEVVANTDIQFRDLIFGQLMNDYNQQVWSTLDAFGEIAPIVGFDYYTYTKNFWMHAYGNWILPYHKYIQGDEKCSYLNRNNWGEGGLVEDSTLEQWSDYQAGIIFGWKISKTLGIFIEGEYTKFWDSKLHQSSVGLNFRL
jgi:hypothetical protein